MSGLGADRQLLGPGGSVLVVDDQPENLELIEEILTHAGYQARLAGDGESALAEVRRSLPDCIVLDVMMPRLDGWETCRRLRVDPQTRLVPIVMLTALSAIADKVRGLEAGADDFLSKPVRPEELVARVRSLVRIRRLRAELDTAESIIFAMIQALETKDARNAGHSERVASMALATAAALGLPAREFEAVGKGALLHDIGKLGVPEPVLLATRRDPDQETAYRRHPEIGARILAPLPSLGPAARIVRRHHERRDGSGYPDGVSGDDLGIGAEIVAAANLYDDLAHGPGPGAEPAAAELRRLAGVGFSREVVQTLLRAGTAAVGRDGRRITDPWFDLVPPLDVERSGKVLVCDDTESNREVLREILEDAGLQVACADGGAAVLPALAEEQPDLVLLDVRMPGLDGFEVCDWIKRSPDTELLPVVLVTAYEDLRDRARSAEAGADDFLTLPIDRLELVARVRSLLRLRSYYRDLEAHQAVVLSLASVLEAKDPYTQGHSERVGELARRLGREIGLDEPECEQLRVAGLLHDIGKVGVPEHLLNKPGPLDDEEFRTILRHPVSGEDICRPLRTIRAVLPLIRMHHERYDGRGYPDGLAGDRIPLGARVLALADAFDALTSDRSYRKRLPDEEALGILARESVEGHWDPGIYAALAALVRRGGGSPA